MSGHGERHDLRLGDISWLHRQEFGRLVELYAEMSTVEFEAISRAPESC